MKQLLDFFPIVLFFVIYKFFLDLPNGLITTLNDLFPFLALTHGDSSDAIYLATLVAIVATIFQVAISAIILRKVEKMPLITLALLVIFGGATLLFKDPLFIQWKPTAINWLFGLVFFMSQFIGDKPLVQRMMAQAITINDGKVWMKLNSSWVLFFALSGFANITVAPAIDPFNFGFSESTWVDFKLFGLMGMTLIFVIAQAFYLARFMPATTEGTD